MKALFITRHYLDQMLGGPNCSKAFVRAVANIYPGATLIYPEHNDHQTKLDFLKGCPMMKLVPVYDRRSKMRKLVDMYRGCLHRFGRFVTEYLADHTFDVIFIDHSFTASSGVLRTALRSGAKIVTIHHNVEKQYIRDNQQNILFRYPYNYYSLRAERKAIRFSDLNLTLTEADADTFRRMFTSCTSPIETIGVFEYASEKDERISDNENPDFVISGSLNALQTESAIIAFLNTYMPVLNKECPDAHLLITGRNPSQRIKDSAGKYKNIRIVENPSDLTAEVMKGNYYICPLHTGGGLKLRCMDALRVGLPVIAHAVSTRGYEGIIDAGYMFSYDTPKSFAEGIHEMLRLHRCHPLVRDSFRANFSYESGEMRLRKILNKYVNP